MILHLCSCCSLQPSQDWPVCAQHHTAVALRFLGLRVREQEAMFIPGRSRMEGMTNFRHVWCSQSGHSGDLIGSVGSTVLTHQTMPPSQRQVSLTGQKPLNLKITLLINQYTHRYKNRLRSSNFQPRNCRPERTQF